MSGRPHPRLPIVATIACLVWTFAPARPAAGCNCSLPFPAGTTATVSQGWCSHGGGCLLPSSNSGSHCSTTNDLLYAIDFSLPIGTHVLAAYEGTVVALENNSTNTTSGWGNYVIIDHGDGSYTKYAGMGYHTLQVALNQYVCRGRWLGNSGDTGVHTGAYLHFQVQHAPGLNDPSVSFAGFQDLSCTVPRCYDSVRSSNEQASTSAECFKASYQGQTQSPPWDAWVRPSTPIQMSVIYQNTGGATWLSGPGGVSNPQYIELRSVGGGCSQVNGALYDASWINAQRVGSATTSPVHKGDVATFAFTARAPAATGDYPAVQWFAPYAASACVNGWAGVNFTVRVDGTPPAIAFASAPPGNYRLPQGISFTATDGHSGVLGIAAAWDNPTPPASPAVYAASGSAGTDGAGVPYAWHTLYVHAWDNAGNVTTAASGPWMLSPNRAPVFIVCPGTQNVNEGAALAFGVTASDPDGDAVTISSQGLPSGATFDDATFRWTPGFDQAGDRTVRFIASDYQYGTPCDVPIHINDVPAPVVQVLYPNGGERLVIGGPALLRWSATDASGITSVDVLLSRTGPTGPFESLSSGIANTGSMSWVVAGPAGTDCWLKVVARGVSGNTGWDLGDRAFSIEEGAWSITWCREQRVTDGVRAAWAPDLALGPDGVHVVWQSAVSGTEGSDVRAARGARVWPTDSLTFQDETVLGPGPSDAAPRIAMDAGGVRHVVWGSASGGARSIQHRSWDHGWGTDEAVRSGPDPRLPAIATGLRGDIHVAWVEGNAVVEPTRFMHRRYAGAWDPVESAAQGGFGWAPSPSIAIDPVGQPVIAWSTGNGFAGTASLSLWSGAWGPPRTVGGPVPAAAAPEIAIDAAGRVHVVWSDLRHGVPEVYYRSFDGSAWSPDVPVSAVDGDSSWAADVGIDGAGRVHVVWAEAQAGDVGVQHRMLAGGWNAPQDVTGAEGRAAEPRIVCEGDYLHIAWTDDRNGPPQVRWRKGTVCPVGVSCDDKPTPVAVSLVDVTADGARVTVRWSVQDAPGSVRVYRHEEGAGWSRVAERFPDGVGFVTYEDTAVVPGHRYGYRLGVLIGTTEAVLGETFIDVPGDGLALQGTRPNPGSPELTVAFSLAGTGTARLEVIDLAGRRVLTREVGGLGAGTHVIPLAQGRPLPPGVYLLRLSQAGRVLTSRAVVSP